MARVSGSFTVGVADQEGDLSVKLSAITLCCVMIWLVSKIFRMTELFSRCKRRSSDSIVYSASGDSRITSNLKRLPIQVAHNCEYRINVLWAALNGRVEFL